MGGQNKQVSLLGFSFFSLLSCVMYPCIFWSMIVVFKNPLVKRKKEKKKPQGFSFVLCERHSKDLLPVLS